MKAAPTKIRPTNNPTKAAKPPKAVKATAKPATSAVDDGWGDVETSAPRRPSQPSLPLPLAVSPEHRAKVAQHVLHLYQSTLVRVIDE